MATNMMITKFNIFEGVSWWKGGKLGPEEEPFDETTIDIKVGDKVRLKNNKKSFFHFKFNKFIDSLYKVGAPLGKVLEIDVIEAYDSCKLLNGWYKMDCLEKVLDEHDNYKYNEGICWWKDGKLGPEEQINDFIDGERFEVGDEVYMKNPVGALLRNGGNWANSKCVIGRHMGPIYAIKEIKNELCANVAGGYYKLSCLSKKSQ